MTGQQVTRRVYSAEELHRLRVSCSQPKLHEAIEEHDGEEAELVKEHVLRGTKSFTARSFRSRTSGNSLRVPSNKENHSTADAENSNSSSENDIPLNGPVLGEISANGQVLRPGFKIRPSPTPSLKKKKAEAIVKAHGSPQHVRVTAGGRIVPSEQSPLCHPRYGYSAIKVNGGLIKFAPTQQAGKTQWTQATQNGFVAQDVEGRLCQIVNGTILPLNEVNGAVRLYVPAPNLNITSRGSSFGPNGQSRLGDYNYQPCNSSLSKPSSPPDPPLPTQTNALELEYSKLEHELKELDKTEVLHGRTMGKVAKEALVAKRRELVIILDNIRKAIKSIKSMPAPDAAPTSPRPSSNDRPASPMRSGIPHILPQRMRHDHATSMPSVQPPQGPFFGFPQPQQFAAEYGFQAPLMPEPAYVHPQFGTHQPPLFVPPSAYDGSIAPPFMHFAQASCPTVPNDGHLPTQGAGTQASANNNGHLPQTDGAGSIKDVQKAKSPPRPHAVDIKVPESKPAMALKSNLNPMSPAYKPGGGMLQNASTANQSYNKAAKNNTIPPLSPVHPLKPAAAEGKAANGSAETISPVKKSPYLHSSSVSSFDTADFFPRNTREYSTRKYAYPESSRSEDKENMSPKQYANASTASPKHVTGSPSTTAPLRLPSTPADPKDNVTARVSDDGKMSSSSGHADHPFGARSLPDRQANNVSPKNRRSDRVFAEEHPSQLPALPSSSPQKNNHTDEEKVSVTSRSVGKIDYSNASVDWIEGYRAGLARRPIEADSAGDFLDGYCAGLLKSKPAKSSPFTGSPMKGSSHRPSPAVIQSRSHPSPFENNVHSTDTLKEAVFSPANEDALLSPAIDGPHINEAPFNLGAWAKNHDLVSAAEATVCTSGEGLAGFPFPHRTASMVKRQAGIMSEDDAMSKASVLRMPFVSEGFASSPIAHRSELPAQKTPDSADAVPIRVVSMTGLDSHLYSQWPAARVFSNQLEWKSASSVAQAAGMAAGHFPHFDRALPTYHAEAAEISTASSHRPMAIVSNPTMHTHSRFHEGSLDGITNPPNSPQLRSPPMSPSLSPNGKEKSGKERNTKKAGFAKDSSPSPTKIKFETMAEKVGIKVSAAAHGGPKSPTGKRGGWRDVWRSSKKEAGKDEGTDGAMP